MHAELLRQEERPANTVSTLSTSHMNLACVATCSLKASVDVPGAGIWHRSVDIMLQRALGLTMSDFVLCHVL